MKICTVVGARPQFIKAAVVSQAFAKMNNMNEIIIHTGQHFDQNMSDIFFEEMGIPIPKYNLGIGGGTHGQNTGRMIEALEGIFIQEQPDYILVYGDTDSTLAGALAAAKLLIPVVHVEAGLRSFNKNMPEEINRILTDHVSKILFVPNITARKNLAAEGIVGSHVHYSGDVMYDAALYFAERAESKSLILSELALEKKDYVLATIHRAENANSPERMREIFTGLSMCSGSIILPIHPRAQKSIPEFGIAIPSNVRLINPVGYLDMIVLEKYARVIATDSGGVQKEAYFHGVPCVTLRDETEWVELVEIGANVLVGAESRKIAEAINSAASRNILFEKEIYGSGDAALIIARFLKNF